MNELKNLEALGLGLPSPAYIAGALFFGLLGLVAFRRGRGTSRPALTWTGVALMVYPYAVPQTWLLWTIGLAFSCWVYVK